MVAVTGTTGFVGRHVVQELAARSLRVRCLVRARSDGRTTTGIGAGGQSSIELAVGDLGDLQSVHGFLDGSRVLIHAAAVTATSAVAAYHRTNAEGTGRLLEAACRAGVKRVVYLSTFNVSLGLADPYSRSKAAGEAAVRACGLPAAILRPGLVYGPGDTKNLAALLHLIRRFRIAPIPGSGNFRWQPIFVGDLAGLVAEHALGPEWTGVRVVTAVGPDAVFFRDLVGSLALALQVRVLPASVPVGLLRLLGLLARPLLGENVFQRMARAAADRTAACLPSGTPVWIGVTPFREGVRRMVEGQSSRGDG